MHRTQHEKYLEQGGDSQAEVCSCFCHSCSLLSRVLTVSPSVKEHRDWVRQAFSSCKAPTDDATVVGLEGVKNTSEVESDGDLNTPLIVKIDQNAASTTKCSTSDEALTEQVAAEEGSAKHGSAERQPTEQVNAEQASAPLPPLPPSPKLSYAKVVAKKVCRFEDIWMADWLR